MTSPAPGIDRIVITGDILRLFAAPEARSESLRRIRWFEDLLTIPLSEVVDLPVERLAAEGGMGPQSLYDDAGAPPSHDAWARLYAGVLPAALRERLVGRCRNALVISIELPPSLYSAFCDAGIPVLDAVVDPHRFLTDIPLAWRTTVPEIRPRLAEFRMTPLEVRRRAAQIRAKTRWLPPVDVPAGATLLLDQTATDAALIDPVRRRSVTWDDYRDQLVALKRQGPILWRAHPFYPPSPVIAEVLTEAVTTTANIYHLLSHDHLTRVAAISSGGVVEARAFGKHGIHFMDRNAGITAPGWSCPIPVISDWLSPHFWSRVLAPIADTRPDAPAFVPEKDFLRRSINCDWGFGWIDRVTAA
jgi:hypothetical protein